ncbi:hypothetical protein NG798_12190 [Ancylothrix sp. C2]|uniref:hypothetical protein n=1 Tax=Ancylothrix sp. D3o TaxID=2953691 RepID=UPI0021BAC8AA|nr:hypothetical protein [Ancylothrix sp. D3o]MCT7950552.1 hypothetical protein [Ancylothrix sp. D3o]
MGFNFMETGIAKVTADRKLELPEELQQRLNPLTEYEVSLSDDEIVLKKIKKRLTLDELYWRIDALEPDPNQPTLEEISQIVKQARREEKTQNL